MRKKSLICLLFFYISISSTRGFSNSLNDSISDKFKSRRLKNVLIAESAIYGGLLVSLNGLWYKNYPRSPFHFFNDNSEWLQIDKLGHAFSSYYAGKSGTELFRWCGVSDKKALLFGGNIGWLFLSSVEVLDGQSKGWGFSWGDIAANSFGSFFYIGQELIFHKQLATMKFSYSPSEFAKYKPNVLGSSFQESLIKDYNGQTYWLSFSMNELGMKKMPSWLNLAIGYGGDGMTGALKNIIRDSKNNIIPSYNRNRQFYFSFDIDLNKIKTKNKLLKTCFKSIGFIKFPAPAIEISNKNIKFHYFYF